MKFLSTGGCKQRETGTMKLYRALLLSIIFGELFTFFSIESESVHWLNTKRYNNKGIKTRKDHSKSDLNRVC